jgi:VWFA-related protein
MTRFVLITLLCGALVAQQSKDKQAPPTAPQVTVNNPAQQEAPDLTPADYLIRVPVEVVTAPVIVYSREGGYVSGIRPDQFKLWDNRQPQQLTVDETFTPISLVIAVQANSHVQGLLPAVSRIGNLVQPLLVGDQGEVAVLAYDSRVRLLQDWTSDSTKVTEAVKKIYPGSTSNRMVDAVVEGTRMLRSRPKERRRVMLLIGETRDLGSESRARETAIAMQLANIMFYAVDMSRFITTLTAPPPVPRPNNLPPAMSPSIPSNYAATPTNVMIATGGDGSSAQFIPLMVELFRDAKAIFKDNPVELFTKATGGSEFGFHGTHTLEEALQHVGEELHSQYTITYHPTNRNEFGFHEIEIDVTGHPDVKRIQHRPGYWLGPETLKANQSSGG